MTMPLRALCCAASTFLCLFVVAFLEAATFTPIGDLPGGKIDSVTTDISDDGLIIVGFSESALGTEAIRWTPDTGLVALSSITGETVPTIARAVSDTGAIAGQLDYTELQCMPGDMVVPLAARWTETEGFIGIGGNTQIAHDISSDGTALTGSTCEFLMTQSGEEVTRHIPFYWSETEGLHVFPHFGEALGMSADGRRVAGLGPVENPDDGFLYNQAFIWERLDPIDQSPSSILTLPDGTLPLTAEAYDISGDGDSVVGVYILATEDDPVEPFRWTPQQGMVGLGNLTEFGGFAYDVSGEGSVVVGEQLLSEGGILQGDYNDNMAVEQGDLDLVLLNWGRDVSVIPDTWVNQRPEEGNIDQEELDGVLLNWGESGPQLAATIWDEENGMRYLQDVLINEYGLGAELEGWTLTRGNGISADGLSVVGFGINPDGDQEGFVVRLDPVPPLLGASAGVPEPSALLLAGIGGALLAGASNRARSRRHLTTASTR